MSRKLSQAERLLGRSEHYHDLPARDQWAEDKRLGILDWDGTKSHADDLVIKRQMGPVLGDLTPKDVAISILERLESTGYGKPGTSNTLAGMVNQLCDEVEALRKQVEELKAKK